MAAQLLPSAWRGVSLSMPAGGRFYAAQTEKMKRQRQGSDWMADFCETIRLKEDSALPKEIQIEGASESSALQGYQNGRIRIVATDQNGMVTEKIRWLHECGYQGG